MMTHRPISRAKALSILLAIALTFGVVPAVFDWVWWHGIFFGIIGTIALVLMAILMTYELTPEELDPR